MRKLLALLLTILTACPAGYSQAGIYVRPDTTTLPAPVTNTTWWFSSTNGQIYVWNGTTFVQISPPHSNLTANTNPLTTNDNTQGYASGSLWLNTGTGGLFVCTNPATGAAVWDLISTNSTNASLLPLALQTQYATGDFISNSVVPSVPGSPTLTIALPGGQGYVNGSLVTISSTSHGFAASSWIYVFINADGSYNFRTQSPMSLPPTIANTVLAYLVETNGTTVTTVVPYFALPGTLRNYMVAVPNTSGLYLQTDTTVVGTGIKWAGISISGLSASGTLANQTLVSTGGNWLARFLPLTGLDTGSASGGNTIQLNSGVWTAQTLDPTGGGTGSLTPPTNGQIPIGSTSTSNYSPANITAGSGIKVTNGANSITLANTGFTASNKSANFNAAADNAYFCTGSLTATLPDATTCSGSEIIVWNTGSGTVSFAVTSSQTINGTASSHTFSSSTQWEMYRFISNGSNWECTKATGPTS